MKGILHKTDKGWRVSHATYDLILERWTAGKLPLHPKYEKYYFLDDTADGGEVEFDIVKEYIDNHTNQVQAYAKLKHPNEK